MCGKEFDSFMSNLYFYIPVVGSNNRNSQITPVVS